MNYKVIQKTISNNYRYIIVDENNKTIDDAQGYGYKTYQNANKVIWYKFSGGKEKIDDYKSFWKTNKELYNYLNELFDMNCKEICRGEISQEELIREAENKFNIKIPKNSLKYM